MSFVDVQRFGVQASEEFSASMSDWVSKEVAEEVSEEVCEAQVITE
jgi:hypothetical protein